jgi:hypothetical protein
LTFKRSCIAPAKFVLVHWTTQAFAPLELQISPLFFLLLNFLVALFHPLLDVFENLLLLFAVDIVGLFFLDLG